MGSMYRKPKLKTFTAKEARTLLGIGLSATARADASKATEKQAAALQKFAISPAECGRLSLKEASELMDALCRRADEGLANLRQLLWLSGRGIPLEDARLVPFADALEFMDDQRRAVRSRLGLA